MIGINHALTGAAIALVVREPVLVVPLALASHFVLDSLPHFGNMPFYVYGHRHFMKVMVADGLLAITALVLIGLAVPALFPVVLLGAACAVLPDILLLDYYKAGHHERLFHKFHLGIQWFERPIGAVVELSYLCAIGIVVATLA